MHRPPYSQFRGQKLTLNDYLAIDRTILANERTLLAYGRTALALAVVGGTLIKFFASVWLRGVGVLFLAIGALIAFRGWQRYDQTKRLLAAALAQQTGAPDHPLKEDATPPSASPATPRESTEARPPTSPT